MPNQAIAKVTDKGTLEGILNGEAFQKTLETVLPKHLTPERVVKMALVAASRQPRLWECTKESILQSIMKSAELGLDCSGTLGRAYLVPYYNSKISAYECQFIPGYQGLIELARRSGNIARIESRVVYERDTFNVEYGLDQKLSHTPCMTGDRGAMTCVYAVAELTDGSRQIEVMTMEEVDAIRSRSKAKDNGPWKTDYPEMARKTVIRRIAKYLPLSTELEKAFEADDQLFNGHSAAVDMAERTANRVSALRDQLTVVPPINDDPLDVVEPEESEPETAPQESTPAEPIDKTESQRMDLLTLAKELYSELKGAKRKQADEYIGAGKVLADLSDDQLTEFLDSFTS
ncbi:recombinase RecT [Geitlerinema calcuttense]|uniref:Recombinase RecT n=1 Tax=Geitlerinema calcuttense NRMC-F 0142 TaxID=2922238 RepID=A0ABT7LX19_9CYAN|nr:recombinase RecT [Geitlerinema calcuttense]MDL5055920.1 recombinase RecT [Geitlerinema calcuttense NRMC-F 0142]